MKCPKCGKEIAEDSMFCEYCGEKITRNIKKTKISTKVLVLSAVAIISVILTIVALIVTINRDKPSNDLSKMNLHGSINKITEITYYTNPETGIESTFEHSGIFDDASFLSVVYVGEHLCRIFYQKWFFSQVSDCEIEFNNYGNITTIRSIHKDGGCVRFRYDSNDKHQYVVEMDSRVEEGNQNEGVIEYSYESSSDKVTERLSQEYKYGTNNITIDYTHNQDNSIKEAFYNDRHIRGYFYYEDGGIVKILFPDYWGMSKDACIKIEYNGKGDIKSVFSSAGGRYPQRETIFEYKYDTHNNWVERKGRVLCEGEVFNMRTVRTYQYN